MGTLEKWAAGLLLLGVALALAFGLGSYTGNSKATKAAEKKAAAVADQHRKALAKKDTETLDKERLHGKAVSDLRVEFAKANAERASVDARVISDLRSGERRLRLQLAPGSCAPVAAAPASAAGADAAPRGELDAETGAALWSIVADGDAATRQLTGLQAYTLKLYETCNGAQAP